MYEQRAHVVQVCSHVGVTSATFSSCTYPDVMWGEEPGTGGHQAVERGEPAEPRLHSLVASQPGRGTLGLEEGFGLAGGKTRALEGGAGEEGEVMTMVVGKRARAGHQGHLCLQETFMVLWKDVQGRCDVLIVICNFWFGSFNWLSLSHILAPRPLLLLSEAPPEAHFNVSELLIPPAVAPPSAVARLASAGTRLPADSTTRPAAVRRLAVRAGGCSGGLALA